MCLCMHMHASMMYVLSTLCMCVYLQVCAHTDVCVCVCVYMCVCEYTDMCIHT